MKISVVQENKIVLILDNPPEELQSYYAKNSQAVIDITDCNPMPEVDWLFDGLAFSPPSGAAVATRKITKLGLRRRMTFPELIALTTAAKTNDAIAALKDNLTVATYVDLNRADTLAAVNYLVAAGLLTSDRATTILSAPIQEDEKYRGIE